MERWQSTFEQAVEYNLAESGVEPLPLGDLLDKEELRALLQAPLAYEATQGAEPLRRSIASLYPGAGPENVLVTTGSSEANFLATLGTLERGAGAVAVLPNYMQVWGVARGLGCDVREVSLREDLGWQLDEEELKRAAEGDPQAISFSNPNNPTGVRLTEASREALVDAAADAEAWLLADEVYRGAERDDRLTPTLWGAYERVLVTAGFSKAFGLPGLRLGWVCGPQDAIERLWSLHDYTTIAATTLSTALGTVILSRGREKLWDRARAIIRRNFPLVEAFVAATDCAWVPPEAGAIAFLRYPWPHPSEAVAERALKREVLVVPGAHFGHEGCLRLGFGMEQTLLEAGLERLEALAQELAREG